MNEYRNNRKGFNCFKREGEMTTDPIRRISVASGVLQN